ncbi:hypothetical protein KCU78_g73, partial [Aureobasidium melanogenum]
MSLFATHRSPCLACKTLFISEKSDSAALTSHMISTLPTPSIVCCVVIARTSYQGGYTVLQSGSSKVIHYPSTNELEHYGREEDRVSAPKQRSAWNHSELLTMGIPYFGGDRSLFSFPNQEKTNFNITNPARRQIMPIFLVQLGNVILTELAICLTAALRIHAY